MSHFELNNLLRFYAGIWARWFHSTDSEAPHDGTHNDRGYALLVDEAGRVPYEDLC